MKSSDELFKEYQNSMSIAEMAAKMFADLVHTLQTERGTDCFKLVSDFNAKFGLVSPQKPCMLSKELAQLKNLHINEEVTEYDNAIRSDDLEAALDALVDIVYVVLGAAYLHGFNFNEAFLRVHKANMAKQRAVKKTDSKRGSTFDIVKPEGWKPADLSDLV